MEIFSRTAVIFRLRTNEHTIMIFMAIIVGILGM